MSASKFVRNSFMSVFNERKPLMFQLNILSDIIPIVVVMVAVAAVEVTMSCD